MENKFKLTDADKIAIYRHDDFYINNKGAKLYEEPTFLEAIEYYRLAAAMGNDQAISNLGYCYLYGRGIEANTDLAIAYFTIASDYENIDALYKLGDIYSSDKWNVKDEEKACFYYQRAFDFLVEGETHFYYNDDALEYPSLLFAIGRESMPNGLLYTNLRLSYEALVVAKKGYEIAVEDGFDYYEESYQKVCKLLQSPILEDAKKFFESYYNLDDEGIEF